MFKRKRNKQTALEELRKIYGGEGMTDILDQTAEDATEEPEESVECEEEKAEEPEESEMPEESEESEAPEEVEESEETGVDDNEAAIEAYIIGANVSREDVESALLKMGEVARTYESGRFDPATVEFILQALHYDEALEKARIEGELEGRNRQIAEAFRNLRDKKEEIPTFNGSALRHNEGSIFDIAKGAR